MSTKNVQDTRVRGLLRDVHAATLDIVAAMNGAARDELLIKEAGIKLDRALFPLLVLIERLGPIGIVDLADRVGRDHSTVSRQVGRLEQLGLVERRSGAKDARVRQAVATAAGKAMTAKVDGARDALGRAVFADWPTADIEVLARLMRRFADAISVR